MLTKWGESRWVQIAACLYDIVKAKELERDECLFSEWIERLIPADYFLASGSMVAERTTEIKSTQYIYEGEIYQEDKITKIGVKAPIQGYHFSSDAAIVTFCKEIVREAENAARVAAGVPKIGEGWISEVELYYALKEAFSDIEVVHHARPDWLGRQHLDVFFPSLHVAIEYQGAQHDRPVEWFGGIKSFEKIQQLDARKLRLCQSHGVTLIYVRPGYTLEDIKLQIANAREGEASRSG